MVLQTFELPLSAFRAVEPGLDPAALQVLWFRFGRTRQGLIIPDDIGLRVGTSAPVPTGTNGRYVTHTPQHVVMPSGRKREARPMVSNRLSG